MTSNLIPNVYRQPYGLPLSWRDEQSGRLPSAIRAYLANRVEGVPLAAADLALVREYCEHYINAPCWTVTCADTEMEAELNHARSEIGQVRTADALSAWIHQCLDLGIDPL